MGRVKRWCRKQSRGGAWLTFRDKGQDMEKLEPLCAGSEIIKWYSQSGKQHNSSSKNLKLESSYHPVIPLLGIYPKKKLKAGSQRGICTPAFITALLTINHMEVTQVSADKWIDEQNVVHACSGILFSLEYYSFLLEGNSDTCYHLHES